MNKLQLRVIDHSLWLLTLARIGQWIAFAGLAASALGLVVTLGLVGLGLMSTEAGNALGTLGSAWTPVSMLLFAAMCWFARCAFQALAGVADLLHRCIGDSADMLRCWEKLRQSFAFGGLLYLVFGLASHVARGAGAWDAGVVYFLALGTLCLHTVVQLLREAGALRAENEGFI